MSGRTTFLATGDSFMTRRLPEVGYPGFGELRDLILAHDVRFNNLEITIHDQEGYPSAFSGGTWAMAEPAVLDSLRSFGFNLYNTANNHSGDYGHGGLLATTRHLRERGLLYAGTGKNLAEASAPAYLDTPNARVALIGVSSTFHDSDAAGTQSPAVAGRPGLNPLRYTRTVHVGPDLYEAVLAITRRTDINAQRDLAIRNGFAPPLPEGTTDLDGIRFELDSREHIETAPLARDMERILASVREARRQADYVLVSIHSHEFAGASVVHPAGFMRDACHACIDAGADAILGHGPHELRGIEIYRKKPIFYSLGNFIFQTDTVSVQPAEAYENAGMSLRTGVGEYMDRRSVGETRGYVVQPNIWRSVVASFSAEAGTIREIRLWPITLHMSAPRSRRGFPELSRDESVLSYLAELSAPYGTCFDISGGAAVVRLS